MDNERLQSLAELEARLGWNFTDKSLLNRALTHRSFANENASIANGDNERLEFLGDAVLQLIVSDMLMKIFPTYTEGQLSKLRASAVNEHPLAELSRKFTIGEHLLLGKGEEASGGRTKPSLLANALESVIAAIFLDKGFECAAAFLGTIFEPLLREGDADSTCLDYKTALQERSMLLFKTIPRYSVLSETGPDHDKLFEMGLFIGERFIAAGSGKSKKEAEKQAARTALLTLRREQEETGG
ncbi:MAG: ribonuclease III [Syntrophales bacterium]|jgi:ribonuclease III|nr:ribonuclease III [Syntrophales bacterium]